MTGHYRLLPKADKILTSEMEAAEDLQSPASMSRRKRLSWARVFGSAMIGAMLLDLWVILFDSSAFVRDEFLEWTQMPSLAFGGGVWFLIYRQIWSAPGQTDPQYERYRNTSPLMRDIGIPIFFIAMVFYVPLNWAIPALVNRAMGDSSVGTLTLTRKEFESGRVGRCNHVWAEELNDYSFGHLCVSDESFRSLRVGDKLSVRWHYSRIGAEISG